MKLVSSGSQQRRDFMYTAEGSVNNSAVVALGRSMSRSLLIIQNQSIGPLFVEFDGPRATATLTNGVVTGCTITNAGFNFTLPPLVRFLGGGPAGGAGPNQNNSYLGLNQPNGAPPSNVATGVAVMTGSGSNKSVASISITNGGSGYLIAPYVQLMSCDLDPYGAALPATGTGWQLPAGQSLPFNGTCCPTEAVAIFGASAQNFVVRWMD